MSGNLKRLRPYEQPPKDSGSLLPAGSDGAAKGFFGFGALWLVTAVGIATLFVYQLVVTDFQIMLELPLGLPTIEVTRDTVAAGFRHAFLWGWLTNAAFGAVFFLTPRMTGRPIANRRTGIVGMVTWNVGFAAGLALLYMPSVADAGSVTAFPLPVNLVLVLALVLISASFWPSLAGTDRPFVGVAWFGIAMLTIAGLAVEATIVGLLDFGATTDAVVEAMWVRGVTLLFLLAVPIGSLHYLVPRLTGRPLASGALAWSSLAAWTVLGLIATFGAAVHPSVPYALVSVGNAATMMLLLPVTMILTNLAMTMQGRWSMALSPGPLAMAMASGVFLLGSAVLAAIGSLREVQTAVAYTSWPAGLAAFALAGASTIGLLAVAEHAWPRMLQRTHSEGLLAYVVTWGTLGGAAVAGVALTVAGVANVILAGDGMATGDIDSTLLPLYLVAWTGLGLLGLGAIAHATTAYLLAAHGRPVHTAAPGGAAVAATAGH